MWEMMKEVGVLGALVACFLIGLFFKDQLGGILAFFSGSAFFPSSTWSLLCWGVAAVLLIIVGVKTNFSVGSVLLFVLFVTHAMVGAVELGTDGWIKNITGNILTPAQGKILFVFVAAHVLAAVHRGLHRANAGLSPIGLLLLCATLAVIGLRMVSGIGSFAGAMIGAGGLRDRQDVLLADDARGRGRSVPRTGAVAMSIMGGIGMMSAGLLGGPGLGYAKDRFTADHLQATAPRDLR